MRHGYSSVAHVRRAIKTLHDKCGFSRAVRILAALFVTQCLFLFLYAVQERPVAPSQSASASRKLPTCPSLPPGLVGPIHVSYYSPTYRELERLRSELDAGGLWRPSNCTAIHRVALIIPFRDRHEHLRTFLNHIHPFLQKQQLEYGIYVVEQAPSSVFNRGMLMNIGYVEASKLRHWDCFIFHDVDLLPENDNNIYSCPSSPRHMSVAVDTMAYRLMYDELFGGIEAFSTEHFQRINGFSNLFFGWGGEDDDLYLRLVHAGLNLTRYPGSVARYRMLNHARSNPSARRNSLLQNVDRRFDLDGLSSLGSGSYWVKVERPKLYTRLYVEINQKYVVSRSQPLMGVGRRI